MVKVLQALFIYSSSSGFEEVDSEVKTLASAGYWELLT